MALSRFDDGAVDDIDLGLAIGVDILKHRSARADRALKQSGNRLPALRFIQRNPLRAGDGGNLREETAHQRTGSLVKVEFVRLEAQKRRGRKRANVQGQLLPNLIENVRRQGRLSSRSPEG